MYLVYSQRVSRLDTLLLPHTSADVLSRMILSLTAFSAVLSRVECETAPKSRINAPVAETATHALSAPLAETADDAFWNTAIETARASKLPDSNAYRSDCAAAVATSRTTQYPFIAVAVIKNRCGTTRATTNPAPAANAKTVRTAIGKEKGQSRYFVMCIRDWVVP
jgi:hypothetical protein